MTAARALLLAVAATALAARLAGAPPLQVQFPGGVETVYVDVFVTADGAPVRGLGLRDFELRDNGVVQEIEVMDASRLPLTALLVFDTSGSVAGEKLAALKAAGAAFVEALQPTDEAGLITFSHEVRYPVAPTQDRGAMRRALAAIESGGATAAHDALFAALALPRSRGRSLVVLFSDGVDNMSWLDEDRLRRLTERSNAMVHVVALTPAPAAADAAARAEPEHHRFLRGLAEATGGRLWAAEEPSRLREAFAAIVQAMNTRYVLGYQPRNVKREGWHQLQVRLRTRGSAHARRGYWVAP